MTTAMIDLKKLAADPEEYRRSLVKRGAESVDVDGVLKAQQVVTQLTQDYEQLRVQSKELTRRAARDEALRAEARDAARPADRTRSPAAAGPRGADQQGVLAAQLPRRPGAGRRRVGTTA